MADAFKDTKNLLYSLDVTSVGRREHGIVPQENTRPLVCIFSWAFGTTTVGGNNFLYCSRILLTLFTMAELTLEKKPSDFMTAPVWNHAAKIFELLNGQAERHDPFTCTKEQLQRWQKANVRCHSYERSALKSTKEEYNLDSDWGSMSLHWSSFNGCT
jgi:hypothetical protein